MDSIVVAALDLIKNGSQGILVLGWVLFVVERYVVSPKRDKSHRNELTSFRRDYAKSAEKVSNTLTSFAALLAVINDRVER